MTELKIEGGTAKSGNLCVSCVYGMEISTQCGENYVMCGNFDVPSRLKNLLSAGKEVSSCTVYQPKGFKSEHELKNIAWILEVSKSRKIGFISPEERRKKESDD